MVWGGGEREGGEGDGGEAQVYVCIECVAECVRPTGVQLYAQLRVCAKQGLCTTCMFSCACMCL